MNHATNRGTLRSRHSQFAEIKGLMCNLYWGFTRKTPTDAEIDRYVELAWELAATHGRRRLHPSETGDGLRASLRKRFPANQWGA